MPILRNSTLDANAFISAIKGDEKYSEKCKGLLDRIGTDFLLIEPTICLAEVYNGVGRGRDAKTADDFIEKVRMMTRFFRHYGSGEQCLRVGKTALEWHVYTTDAFYPQTSLDFNTILVSLDKEEFIDEIKRKNPSYEAYHIADFDY
jgi:predicted nucleic acid-binding protein